VFKNIEKIYKKESVYNKILKRITICFIFSVLLTWSLILLNLGYLSVIIPIAVFFIVKRICEKHLKTKLYYKLFPSDSFLTLEELSEQKEKEMFKKYTINKKMYNEVDLKNIIHHYRSQQVANKKDDKFLEVLLSICSIIIPLLQSKNVENTKIKEKMQSCNSISIHLRRGDYLTPENQGLFGGICTEEYYESALLYMKEKVADARFFVFSDDPNYAREKYQGEECTIVDINHGKESFYDIDLMSSCKHHICANSTFSFWGARLNPRSDKIMIRPLKQKNCDWYVPEKMKQLWKNWILIDEKGKKW
jgi:hypothetical protein